MKYVILYTYCGYDPDILDNKCYSSLKKAKEVLMKELNQWSEDEIENRNGNHYFAKGSNHQYKIEELVEIN